MRYYEISNGYKTIVNNEEQKLLDMAQSKKVVPKSELDDRQQIVAKNLVNRSLLKRSKDDKGNTIFKYAEQELRRD